jgi:hypothetical protein
MAFCMEVRQKMVARLPHYKNAAATATATIMTSGKATSLVAAGGYRKLSILGERI